MPSYPHISEKPISNTFFSLMKHGHHGRIQDFLIGGELNNLGYRGRGTQKK